MKALKRLLGVAPKKTLDDAGRSSVPACECTHIPACRRDHHCKQAPGWTVTQLTPGYFTWTTPAGRTYTTAPTAYLA